MLPKTTSTTTGMTTVSSSCSPLRSTIRISSPVWASSIRDSGAAPGCGVKVIVGVVIRAAPSR